MIGTKQKWIFIASALLIVALFYLPYLTGHYHFFQDSMAVQTNFHLFYSRLFAGVSPLWSPELNSGHPAWLTYELSPFFDPLVFVIYFLSFISNVPSNLAYQIVTFGWLLCFSLGGLAMATRITKNPWILLGVFMILFAGPVAASSVGQSYGFLVPFRTFPWVLFFWSRYVDRPNRRDAAAFGAMTVLGHASYQSPYALFFIAIWMAFDLRRLRRAQSISAILRDLGSVALIYFLASSPTLLAFRRWAEMEPVSRTLSGVAGWVLPWEALSFWNHHAYVGCSHGCTYVGYLPALLVLLGLATLIWRVSSTFEAEHGLERVRLFVMTVLGFFMTFIGPQIWSSSPEEATFLGLRNWGFALPVLILCLTLWMARGWKNLETRFPKIQRTSWLIYLVIVVDLAVFIGNKRFYLRRSYDDNDLRWSVDSRFRYFRKGEYVPQESSIRGFPYIMEGPALLGEEHASIPTRSYGLDACESKRCVDLKPMSLVSHQLRLPRFHSLETGVSKEAFYMMAGVDQPKLKWMASVEWVESGAVRKALASKPSAFFERSAIVEGTPKPLTQEISIAREPDLHMVKYSRTDLQVRLTSEVQGYLYYADSWDHGWTVELNGQPAQLLNANLNFKAVEVPPGTHLVTFIYRQPLYIAASVARSLMMFVCLGFLWCRRKELFPE